MTDDCNFDCTYCIQKKAKKYMKRSSIKKAVDFFYPFLEEEAIIPFYGGEPLLAFDEIKYTVSLFKEKNKGGGKNLKFEIVTNGSFLTEDILRFFDHHQFNIALSLDGISQEISRKPDSLAYTLEQMKCIQSSLYPDIGFFTNSVFSPKTVNCFYESILYIIDAGGEEIQFGLAENEPWDDDSVLTLESELERLADFLLSHYKKTKAIPVVNFRGGNSISKQKIERSCDAGGRRMAITPDETLWGCLQFHDYLKTNEDDDASRTYSFGKLDNFIKKHEHVYPQVLENYITLKQDYFFTEQRFCYLCKDLEKCSFCPVYAAHATSFIGKIPTWMCRINKIRRKIKKTFLKKIEP
ncbi:MAG: radical SAM protein [bacterium]|nr:radical SAM protein [bacterium]